MLKKTITYIDYDGNERTEDFYFNLSKAEVMEMEMSHNGGMTKLMQQIVAKMDGRRIMETFKDIIMRAYGEKSLDGKYFVKSPELSIAFTQTEAYSVLFMELLSDSKAAADFMNQIVPQTEETGEAPAAKPTLVPAN